MHGLRERVKEENRDTYVPVGRDACGRGWKGKRTRKCPIHQVNVEYVHKDNMVYRRMDALTTCGSAGEERAE